MMKLHGNKLEDAQFFQILHYKHEVLGHLEVLLVIKPTTQLGNPNVYNPFLHKFTSEKAGLTMFLNSRALALKRMICTVQQFVPVYTIANERGHKS